MGKKSPFTMFPNSLWGLGLKPSEFMYMSFLYKWSGHKTKQLASKFIAIGTGLNKKTVDKCKMTLKELKLIYVDESCIPHRITVNKELIDQLNENKFHVPKSSEADEPKKEESTNKASREKMPRLSMKNHFKVMRLIDNKQNNPLGDEEQKLPWRKQYRLIVEKLNISELNDE